MYTYAEACRQGTRQRLRATSPLHWADSQVSRWRRSREARRPAGRGPALTVARGRRGGRGEGGEGLKGGRGDSSSPLLWRLDEAELETSGCGAECSLCLSLLSSAFLRPSMKKAVESILAAKDSVPVFKALFDSPLRVLRFCAGPGTC